jgi:GPI ethanolamine phosphate transferase membrane region
VWRYLDAYAAAPGTAIPQADIAALHALLQSARASHSKHFLHKQQQQQQQQQQRQRTAHKQQQHFAETDAALRQTCRLYRRFLDAAIGLGRRLWTQYDLVLMALGTAVQCAALLCICAKLLCVNRGRLLLAHAKQHDDTAATTADTVTVTSAHRAYSSRSTVDSSVSSSASAEAVRAVAGAAAGAAVGYTAVLAVPSVFSAPTEAVVALAAVGSSAAVASYWCDRCYCLLRPLQPTQSIHKRITTTAAAEQHQRRSSSNSSSSRQQVPSISGVWLCSTALPVLVTVLYCCSVFSNSFIAAEHTLHLYLGSTLLLALVALAAQTQAQARTSAVPLCCAALLFRLAAATLTADLPAAVNEDATTAGISGNSSAEHSLSLLRTALPLAAAWCLFARATTVIAARSSALHAAQLLAVLCYWQCEAHASAAPAASAVAAAVHAVTAVLPQGLQLRLLLPRIVYVLSTADVVSALCRPTALAAATNTTARRSVHSVTRALVVALAQHSSSVILLLTTPSLAYVIPSLLAAAALLMTGLSSLHTRQLPQLQLLLALLWALGTRAAFFFTGHHNQFSRLQYACAFIGFDDFNAGIGGSLLFVNTFGLEILGILALPLAAVCISSSSTASSSSVEETVLAFAGLSAARTLLSTVNAVVQRRHLMLWAVFAPKFVFDAVMQAVVGAALVLMWAVVARASAAAAHSSS